MNQQKAAFFEQYAPQAMVQQQKYGIPASVTLAQMYIESAGGTSNLAQNGNNYFGIKCSSEWLAAGKSYSLHNDDRPNEKFCNYASVEESIEHHSQFLMGNRYAACRRCAADDYRGWAYGLQSAGYATNRNYANMIIADIEAYGLHRYDEQAKTLSLASMRNIATKTYSFPLEDCNLVMSDGFGMGATGYRHHQHNGIDLRASYENVLATEDEGHVVNVGSDRTSGNFVVVEYAHDDGTRWRVSYCHLDSVAVKRGDMVNAGTKLGVSGNTGNSTGPHLHLTVKRMDWGGTEYRTVDPLDYLADIAGRGNLAGTVVRKGTTEDLLAARKAEPPMLSPVQQQNALAGAQLAQRTGSDDPNTLLAYLMGQNNDEQQNYGHGDIITSLISGLFTSAVGMAIMLDQSNKGCGESIAIAPVPEVTEQQGVNTLIQRRRDSIDPEQARATAMMNFDAEYPEEQQGNGQRLA